MTSEPGSVPIKRRLLTRLRQIDPKVLRDLAEDWAANPRHALLLQRHFLVGLCGHWGQGLDGILKSELALILSKSKPSTSPRTAP